MKNSVKCLSTLLICSFLLFNCMAQTAEVTKPKPAPVKENSPANEQPQFPGGKAELMKFMQKNISYPAMAREDKIQGTVEVSFVVDATGAITKPKVTKGIGGGCDEEALKMVSKMPKWIPGKKDGNATDIECSLPVKFNLK